jgi:hypothetical protein
MLRPVQAAGLKHPRDITAQQNVFKLYWPMARAEHFAAKAAAAS